MRKFLAAVAAAAAISATLALLPAPGTVQARSVAAAEPVVIDAGCARAWPYPQCEQGRLPARSIRLITTDRMAPAE